MQFQQDQEGCAQGHETPGTEEVESSCAGRSGHNEGPLGGEVSAVQSYFTDLAKLPSLLFSQSSIF